MTLRIDSHQHFWQLTPPPQRQWAEAPNYDWLQAPAMAPICRDYLPDDLLPHLRNAGVDATVFVQTQHLLEENRWVLELAEQHGWIAGVVGWVDLASQDCERQLEELQSHSKFVGIRHIVQDEPDEDFIIRADVIRGLKTLERHGVPFDLLFYVQHLRHAATLADQLPNLPMVIDHLAKPKIKAGSIDDWLPQFREAAKRPNVWCKLSGMVTEADWQHWKVDDLRPYVDAALEHFGPGRCMFGSDWPVCELAGSYEQVHQAAVELLSGLSTAEQDQIFGGVATKFYGLTF